MKTALLVAFSLVCLAAADASLDGGLLGGLLGGGRHYDRHYTGGVYRYGYPSYFVNSRLGYNHGGYHSHGSSIYYNRGHPFYSRHGGSFLHRHLGKRSVDDDTDVEEDDSVVSRQKRTIKALLRKKFGGKFNSGSGVGGIAPSPGPVIIAPDYDTEPDFPGYDDDEAIEDDTVIIDGRTYFLSRSSASPWTYGRRYAAAPSTSFSSRWNYGSYVRPEFVYTRSMPWYFRSATHAKMISHAAPCKNNEDSEESEEAEAEEPAAEEEKPEEEVEEEKVESPEDASAEEKPEEEVEEEMEVESLEDASAVEEEEPEFLSRKKRTIKQLLSSKLSKKKSLLGVGGVRTSGVAVIPPRTFYYGRDGVGGRASYYYSAPYSPVRAYRYPAMPGHYHYYA